MSRSKGFLISAAIAWAVAAAPASALDVKLEVVAEGLTHPMIMVSPPGDDRKFIVENNVPVLWFLDGFDEVQQAVRETWTGLRGLKAISNE